MKNNLLSHSRSCSYYYFLFKLYLQGNRIFEFKQVSEQKNGGFKTIPPFRISIHDPISIADLRDSGVDIVAGYISTFLITPEQKVTSPEVQSLSINKCNCSFPTEGKPTENLIIVNGHLCTIHEKFYKTYHNMSLNLFEKV